jgi:erythromycin esterase-like protein
MSVQATHRSEELLSGRSPLTGGAHDYDALLDRIEDRRFVLLGEASHGTHDFYRERIRITKRLIEEKGFNAIAVEADWPDAYRVNRFVMGLSNDEGAVSSLGDFKRFPAWMWRNTDVVDFIDWLRNRNDSFSEQERKARFYGLDLYSLRASMEAVVTYLEDVEPLAAQRARQRYSCFDHVGGEGVEYGRAATVNPMASCENEVVAQLIDLRHQAEVIMSRDGWAAGDEFFFAEQNARLVHNAEHYYRSMYQGNVASWNVRDLHMAETLNNLAGHLDNVVGHSKVVVWEHNSHVGDARATAMGRWGELNVGQLTRSTWGDRCVLVGFTTNHGWVTAATDWGDPAERKRVRHALSGSYEEVFHQVDDPSFMVLLDRSSEPWLKGPMLERAIGVIYRPETERTSHWFDARMADQFDAIIHIDETTAVVPLERNSIWDAGEPPETFPSGI